jgi:xylose dehydrogenase (NAD/NADP)
MAGPLKIGILSTARIAEPYIHEVKGSKSVEVTAVASRDKARAEAFARKFDLGLAHDRYEDLLADPDIDIIYNSLPNSLHVEWSERALEAGKHVLCEKPFSDDPATTKRAFALADKLGLLLLEAFPYRFQPFMDDIEAIAAMDDFGPLRQISAAFGFTIPDEANIRFKPELAGGAIMDAGCYCVSFARAMAGVAPKRVKAAAKMHPSGVDVATMALLEFPDGLQAQITCSFESGFHRSATLIGAQGVLDFAFPNSPFPGERPTYRIRRAGTRSYEFDTMDLRAGPGFRLESEALADMIAGNRSDYALFAQESLDNAATLAAIKHSAEAGGWVDVAKA